MATVYQNTGSILAYFLLLGLKTWIKAKFVGGRVYFLLIGYSPSLTETEAGTETETTLSGLPSVAFSVSFLT